MSEIEASAAPRSAAARLIAPKRSTPERLWRGAIAGMLAGLIMLLFTAASLRISGPGFWAPLKLAAGAVLGENATASGGFALGPVALGFLLWLLISALLGALYGLLFRGMPISPSLVIMGPIYGFLIWIIAFLVFLPRFDPLLIRQFTPWALFVGDLIFGLALGALYPIVRDTTAEAADATGS